MHQFTLKPVLFLLFSCCASLTFAQIAAEGKTPLEDRAAITELQQAAFRYARAYVNPVTGLVLERSNDADLAATGATGFAVAAIPVGVTRSFLSREEALQWLTKLTHFLVTHPKRKAFHGAFSHWMKASTGDPLPFSQNDTAADLVETCFLMQGLLIAREFFNGDSPQEQQARKNITTLWEELDFQAFLTPKADGLYWHFNPGETNLKFPIKGFNEALIVYILALSSPSSRIPPSVLQTWFDKEAYVTRNYWGHTIEGSVIYSGPLFHSPYSFIGLNPKEIADKKVPHGYFVRGQSHALIHRTYCLHVANKNAFAQDLWGLTSSMTPKGYLYSSPVYESGTVAPTAALSSLPFVPQYAFEVLHHIKETPQYNTAVGSVDAIAKTQHWVSPITIGIDQLPIVCLTENYRTGLLWNLFMKIEDVRKGLKRGSFHPPLLEEGFPEMPLVEEGGVKICDLRRHPDTERFAIDFSVVAKGPYQLQLLNEKEDVCCQTEGLFDSGRQTWILPKNFVPTKETFLVKLVSTEKTSMLRVRFH